MNSTAPAELTQLLLRSQAGDRDALEALLPEVYAELRRLAAHYLAAERSGHTLQATALVHEAYLRLIDQHSVDWSNRGHFFSIAAQTMRRVLVNHARDRQADKRGAGAVHLTLSSAENEPAEVLDLLRVDDALLALAQFDARAAQVVELKFFGGLEIDEIATALGVSSATVRRDWLAAKAWLKRELQE